MTTVSITDPQTNETISVELMTRDAYLAKRAAWKADYRKLSQNIREVKLARKAADRACEYAKVSGLASEHNILRDYATAALEERRIMKLAAKASYEADREERLAA